MQVFGMGILRRLFYFCKVNSDGEKVYTISRRKVVIFDLFLNIN